MNEHHRDLLRELAAVGIKPRLRKTPGGHVRIEWDLGGKSYSTVTSMTPSDRRSTINAKAHIRRRLRDAGVYQQRQPRSPLPRAIAARRWCLSRSRSGSSSSSNDKARHPWRKRIEALS